MKIRGYFISIINRTIYIKLYVSQYNHNLYTRILASEEKAINFNPKSINSLLIELCDNALLYFLIILRI